MDNEAVFVDESATHELPGKVRSADTQVAVELVSQALEHGPTSPCTRRPLCSTRGRLVEKTIFGIGFQMRANSRIASVADGSSSPVGQ